MATSVPSEDNSGGLTQVTGFDRFSIFIKNAIEEISSGVSEEEFDDVLGKLTVIKKNKAAPGKIRKKMKQNLEAALSSEIDLMVEEENVKENLHQLDKLIIESMLDEGRKTWRPNGNVNDHMRTPLMEVKEKFRDELEKNVAEKEREVDSDQRKLKTMRTLVQSLESELLSLKRQTEKLSTVDKFDRKVVKALTKLE